MTPAKGVPTPHPPHDGRDGRDSAHQPEALLVDDERFEHHRPPGHHPERPERLRAARGVFAERRDRFSPVVARSATDEELAAVHDPAFVERLGKLRGQRGYLDPDTYVSPESIDVARLAAGSVTAMVQTMLAGPIRKGVALVRPPGHHSGRARAMGFCLLNNVAVATASALAHGLTRIAIVDWDVHHGNGTQDIFWRDPRVVYVSLHQFPFYPGTGDVSESGEGDAAGHSVNIPLAAGGGDSVYVGAFERIVVPVLAEFQPELVLVSAGFDASARDPLAQMQLSPAAYGWMARALARIADESAQGRIALVLEGGYDLVALESGLQCAIDGMLHANARDLRAADDAGVDRAARWAKKAWRDVT